MDISPTIDRFLDEHGNEPVVQFVISRTILNPLVTGAIGVLSPSFRRKTQDTKLYHLQVLMKTNQSQFGIEKNQRITTGRYQNRNGSENMPVSIPQGLNLHMILERTHSLMGGKFLPYSAFNNNCQNFILAMLQSNNLSTSQNVLFTKQATQHLFTPQLRKITNTITDIAGKVDIIRQGGDIKPKNRWIQHVQLFAKDNNIGYFKALSNPKCKSTYEKKI